MLQEFELLYLGSRIKIIIKKILVRNLVRKAVFVISSSPFPLMIRDDLAFLEKNALKIKFL